MIWEKEFQKMKSKEPLNEEILKKIFGIGESARDSYDLALLTLESTYMFIY